MELEDILAPISIETFISQYKGEKHFLSKGSSERVKNLFCWHDLNHVLFSQRLGYPRFRLIKNGEVLSPEIYTDLVTDRRNNPFTRINAQRLKTELSKGCAIHILNAEEFSKNLTRICEKIGGILNSDVGMTIHVGMKESKGLDRHWDSHDVFVVQLEGKKRWRLYGFTEKYPFRIGPGKNENITNEIQWEGDLMPGDVLYLPRGYWHEAQAYDQSCMHLSIGMFNPKATDYLNWLSTQLIELEFFRKDIPLEDNCDIFLTELRVKLFDYINAKSYKVFRNKIANKYSVNNFELPNLNK
jgi:ribosomal protein L16 Arg81 hydroxylase